MFLRMCKYIWTTYHHDERDVRRQQSAIVFDYFLDLPYCIGFVFMGKTCVYRGLELNPNQRQVDPRMAQVDLFALAAL